jgi:hypothetical protein
MSDLIAPPLIEGGVYAGTQFKLTTEIIMSNVSAGASGANVVVSGATGVNLTLTAYTVVAAGTVTATWYKGASDPVGPPISLIAGTPVTVSFDGSGLGTTDDNQNLVLHLSGAVTVGGHAKVQKTTVNR